MANYFFQYDANFRISATSDLSKGWFIALQIPPPNVVDYQPFTEYVPEALGGESQQGYSYVTFVWNTLQPKQANRLKGFIATVLATPGNVLYLTIPRTDASSCSDWDWIDVSGIPIMPRWNTPQDARRLIYTGVEFKVNNLTIVNDPASGV